ncbi:MAG: molybdopterin molybdotransferase MoeA, partial [Gammaproteobacteria bacterium]
MTQPTERLFSVDEALALIDDALPRQRDTTVDVTQAHGRVLRQRVVAERDQPPFDRATMDGVALKFDDRQTRYVATDVAAAGAPPPTYRGVGTCVEIMTGAVVPQGTDCVVPVEETQRDAECVVLAADATLAPDRYIHRRGSDHRAGTTLLEPGVRMNATHVAVLVSAGVHAVDVAALPRIGVIATGDELVDVRDPILPHQIRRSNDYAAVALLAQHGYTQTRTWHVRDDRSALSMTLQEALDECDVLVLTGGVSKGRYDYVPDVLAALGVNPVLHRVAQRPGKPMWFGTGPRKQSVFALPGNPVSALTCLRRYVVEALHKMSDVTDL